MLVDGNREGAKKDGSKKLLPLSDKKPGTESARFDYGIRSITSARESALAYSMEMVCSPGWS